MQDVDPEYLKSKGFVPFDESPELAEADDQTSDPSGSTMGSLPRADETGGVELLPEDTHKGEQHVVETPNQGQVWGCRGE